jgi:hypothetical protein
MRRWGVWALILVIQAQTALAWDLNDVSFLLPLPTDLRADPTLVPSTSAQAGELLPERYLGLLPPLAGPNSSVTDQLAVVGIRIDPCFPGIDPLGGPCHSQIRMMWQPLSALPSGISATDAAVHSFYELTADEFKEFIGKLLVLNATSGTSTSGLSLSVHPAMIQQGLQSPYWAKLRALVLAYTGDQRLTRVTFMTQETPNIMWDFGGFDIAGGKVTRMVIPRVQTRLQSFVNNTMSSIEFLGGEKPEAPETDDTFNSILTDSSKLTEADVLVLRASVDSIYRIENPKLNSPATIDCASCHAAQVAREWAVSKFPDLGLDQSSFRFTSLFNLRNSTTPLRSTHVMRAFGYQGKLPAISQRTINESAAIAESLSSPSRHGF